MDLTPTEAAPGFDSSPDPALAAAPARSVAARGGITARKPALKVLYALGPGDVVGLYRELLSGKQPPFQMGLPFSKQFLDWCEANGMQAHLIASHARKDSLENGRHLLENIPKSRLVFRRGIKSLIGSWMYGLAIVGKAIRERPAVVIVDSGTAPWMSFAPLAAFRIPVIAVMHNALWPRGFPPARLVQRLYSSLDAVFFRRFAGAAICVSPECERQIRMLAPASQIPVYQSRAQYRNGLFDRIDPPPPLASPPFRVLFLGRLVDSKGIFDILSMAERLEAEMPGRFQWKIVGAGQDREALRRRVLEQRLGHAVEVGDSLPDEETARETFGWSSAVLVPTTSRFCEGFAMVAAEAILAGRPAVVSDTVPAWEVLGDAAIKVPTGDIDRFVAALRRLATDPEFYQRCRQASVAPRMQFYDRSQGLGARLGQAIARLIGKS